MKTLVIVAALVFCVANGHARSTSLEEVENEELLHLDKEFAVKDLASSLCNDCTAFIGDIRHMYLSNHTQKIVAHSASEMACSKLKYFTFTCDVLIKAYVPLIMNMIGHAIDTPKICHAIKFCTTSSTMTLGDEANKPNFPSQEMLREMATKFLESVEKATEA